MKWAGIVVIKHIHTEYKLYSTYNNMEHTSEIITCLNTIWRSFPIEIRFDKNLTIDINLHVNKIGIQKKLIEGNIWYMYMGRGGGGGGGGFFFGI